MEANEEKRTEYLKKVEEIAPEDQVYIDESGMDSKYLPRSSLGKARRIDQSPKKRAYYLRTNIIAGLVKNKSIAPFVFNGACNTELFNEWVERCLIRELKLGQTVILDNASFHNSPKTKELHISRLQNAFFGTLFSRFKSYRKILGEHETLD